MKPVDRVASVLGWLPPFFYWPAFIVLVLLVLLVTGLCVPQRTVVKWEKRGPQK